MRRQDSIQGRRGCLLILISVGSCILCLVLVSEALLILTLAACVGGEGSVQKSSYMLYIAGSRPTPPSTDRGTHTIFTSLKIMTVT